MKIVYFAGPYRADTAWAIEQNVRRVEEQAVLLVEKFGIMPLIPHANTRFFHGLGTDELWLEGTMELMRRATRSTCVLAGSNPKARRLSLRRLSH